MADYVTHDGELREFMMVVRDALLMVVRYIERRYGLRSTAAK